ncbi:hypothetical protein [Shinella sp.]|uniref:hypothetical protein n=1 Tax=Shinella sp. TaxID=1870904 RepID=UPI0028B224A5|nr:hypothetical protein [Shinella sp.]
MNSKLLDILQRSLGLDEYGRGTFYRNRFVTGEGSTDHPLCMELVELGYMERFAAVELFGGSDAFTVTEEGKRAAVAESPAPPKISRSKQRYLDFLAYDGSMTFMEYLRWRDYRDRRSA